MRNLPFILVILVGIVLFGSSCKKDSFSGDAVLTFSEDTVIFDTVFTTIGSVTRQFKVYNPSSDAVTINSIVLAGGTQSKYRMNVDGLPGVAFNNISIQPKDSLFIFVDVTLDPNGQLGTIMVTDSIVFNTDGIIQDVDLAACGWDAEFYYPTDYIEGLGSYSIIDCNTTWTADRPYVIYGWAVVDEGCTLTIEAGTNVFSHKNSGILVYSGGTLKVMGDVNNRVTFASDRLDEFYRDQAGEWNRIWLFRGSLNNVIEGAWIKNGNVGIQVDSSDVMISNTIVDNMGGASLFTQTGTVEAYNCVFGNAGQYSAALSLGGNYEFYHCTFGNYWVNGNRQTPAVLLNNWYEFDGTAYTFNLENAYFGNCIVYGNNLSELGLDKNPAANFNFKFERCLIRVDAEEVDVTNSSEFVNPIFNQDPEFVDPSENNFELDTLSPARNVGLQAITNVDAVLSSDVIGTPRPYNGGQPDLGAYERQE